MPHVQPACHLPHARVPDSSQKLPTTRGIPCQTEHRPDAPTHDTLEHVCDSGPQAGPVHGDAQEIQHTASRRTGPRRWLRAVEWLIAAGQHPRANATTLAIAQDLKARMDYDTGHARYCLEETAGRLRIDKSTVKRHVSYLRELGALAWVVHGTKTNVRRALGMSGYAATATVYAAVIPA